jgi:hypothetical protein
VAGPIGWVETRQREQDESPTRDGQEQNKPTLEVLTIHGHRKRFGTQSPIWIDRQSGAASRTWKPGDENPMLEIGMSNE